MPKITFFLVNNILSITWLSSKLTKLTKITTKNTKQKRSYFIKNNASKKAKKNET